MEFALTPRLRSAIERAMLRGGDSAVLAPCARDDARGISLEHVRLLSRLLREEEPRPPHVWVHELLEGAMPQLPAKPEKRAPHPELAPRLERLRAAQEAREYFGDLPRHRVQLEWGSRTDGDLIDMAFSKARTQPSPPHDRPAAGSARPWQARRESATRSRTDGAAPAHQPGARET